MLYDYKYFKMKSLKDKKNFKKSLTLSSFDYSHTYLQKLLPSGKVVTLEFLP